MIKLANKLIKALTGKFNAGAFPPVQDPKADATALYTTATGMKIGYEVLTRRRGDVGDSALLVKEIDYLLELLVAELDARYNIDALSDSSTAETLEGLVDDFENLLSQITDHMSNTSIHGGGGGGGDTIIVEGDDDCCIDDGAVVTVKTWSSVKISSEIAANSGGNSGAAATADLVAGEDLFAGEICGMAVDGTMVKATVVDDTTSKRLIGVIQADTTTGNTGTFLLNGFTDTTAVTTGDVLYLSTTAGVLSTVPPAGSGEVVRVIGYATSSTSMYFNPDRTWFVLA